MPFVPQPSEKCPLCGKSVYHNESRMAAGKKWHIMCFKCFSCNKMLESTNVTEHEGRLYCKTCHGKNFGPKGYGFGQGAGVLSMESAGSGGGASRPAAAAATGGQQVEGGCPRCGRRVYEAEKKIGAGKEWHRSCFNCANCKKSLDSTTLSDKDGEIYCKGCYGKLFGPKGVGYGIGAGTLSM